MSIGFFYNKLDWINRSVIKHLRTHNVNVEPININTFTLDVHNKHIFKHKLYINRVYPSSNLYSFNNLRFMLEIIRHIENLGITVINPFDSAYADYSKTESNNILEKYDIPTPHTLLFSNTESARRAAERITFPRIIKMDAGGRAINIFCANTKGEYSKIISKLGKEHLIHVEKFYKACKGYSTRLFILDYKFRYATKKTLVEGWIGNPARGSKTLPYTDAPVAVRKLGEDVAKVTKSEILGLDIIETKQFPVVVDVNSTPVFHPHDVILAGFDPSEKIADLIFSEYKKTG